MSEEPHSEYQSLTATLHGWFDHEFKDLPSAIKLRLEKDYVHVSWDKTDAQGRENLAAQIDYQNDPAYAEECEYWFNRYNDMDDLRDKIEEWERLEANTPSDRVIKEDRIEALKAQLAEIDTSRMPPANLNPPTRTPRRRRDILSAVINDAIIQAGSDDCETVWLKLREAAQNKTNPFNGTVDARGLHYTNSQYEDAVFARTSLAGRLYREKKRTLKHANPC